MMTLVPLSINKKYKCGKGTDYSEEVGCQGDRKGHKEDYGVWIQLTIIFYRQTKQCHPETHYLIPLIYADNI